MVTRWLWSGAALLWLVWTAGCDRGAPDGAPSAGATGSTATATAAASATARSTASPTGSAAAVPCPVGTGEGTFFKPCKSSGEVRMMLAKWTGAMKDKGAVLAFTNKSKHAICQGTLRIYYYDAQGKQLEITSSKSKKKFSYSHSSGGIFQGCIKAGQTKAIAKGFDKKDLPPTVKTVEAEVSQVGWDVDGDRKQDVFWSNSDLAPAERAPLGSGPKGER